MDKLQTYLPPPQIEVVYFESEACFAMSDALSGNGFGDF
jgi:hypothetical protein